MARRRNGMTFMPQSPSFQVAGYISIPVGQKVLKAAVMN